MLNKVACMRKMITVTLMITVASFSSLITSRAMAQASSKLAGELAARGSVTLNGLNATTGATVFNGSNIKTGNKGGATLNLGKLGQIELSSDSEIVLNLNNGVIGGELRAGRAVVSAPMGVGVNIMTAEGLAVAEGKEATLLTVDVTCGNTRVASTRNEAKVTAGSRVEVVAAGQEVAVGSQTGDSSRCPRMAGAAAQVNPTISGGALAALILIGVGSAVGGIVAATQGDNSSQGVVSGLSTFKP